MVPNFFKKEELEPVLKGIEGLVEKVAEKLHKAGKIKGNYNSIIIFILSLRTGYYISQTCPFVSH